MFATDENTKEYKRRSAVTQRGKNTRAEIVKHEKRQSEVIDIEIIYAFAKRFLRSFQSGQD